MNRSVLAVLLLVLLALVPLGATAEAADTCALDAPAASCGCERHATPAPDCGCGCSLQTAPDDHPAAATVAPAPPLPVPAAVGLLPLPPQRLAPAVPAAVAWRGVPARGPPPPTGPSRYLRNRSFRS